MPRVQRQSVREIAERSWYEFYEFVIPFGFDSLIGGIIVLVLGCFAKAIVLGKSLGMPEDDAKAIERLHFWLTYGLFLMIGLSFIFRVGLRIRESFKNVESDT